MVHGGGDGRTDGGTDGQMDRRLEIPPGVLQDIGPLGPLPKKGTDRPTDGRTKRGVESRSTRLKSFHPSDT